MKDESKLISLSSGELVGPTIMVRLAEVLAVEDPKHFFHLQKRPLHKAIFSLFPLVTFPPLSKSSPRSPVNP